MATISGNIENKISDLQKGKRECINMDRKGHQMDDLAEGQTPSHI